MRPRVALPLLAVLAVVTQGLLLGGAAPAAATPLTWNFTQADVYAAQAPAGYGRGVTVAVIDTGVDASHAEFGGRVLPGVDCTSGTCSPGDAAPAACDEGWHGTHVAGTIASSDYGVAPASRILPLRVFPDSPGQACGAGFPAIAAAIRYGADVGAQVENLSLGDLIPGLTQDSGVTSAVAYAAAHGVVVCFAAGNGDPVLGAGLPFTDSYGSNALVVAATDNAGQLASYSNFGGNVDVAAPGGDGSPEGADNAILSTYPGNRLAYSEGTSMATPHVAGLAALLLSQAPSRGRADVVNAITGTAVPLAGAGSGRIDAAAAVRLRPSVPSPTATATAPSPKPVVRRFAGCPRTVTVRLRTRPVVRCRVTPGTAGLTVLLQQRVGRSYRTVARVHPGRDGRFAVRLPSVRSAGAWRLQLGSGAHRPVTGFAVRVRR